MLAYHNKDFDPDGSRISDWEEQLLMLPARTIKGAEAVLGNIGKVYRMMAAGFLRCDLSKPISDKTTITYKEKGEPNVEIFI